MSLGLESSAASAGAQPLAAMKGVSMPTTQGGRGGFLDDVIVELGFASRTAVDEAVQEARQPGKVFSQTLIDNETISEDELAIAIAERNGLPYVDLDEFQVNPGVQRLIGRSEAQRYRAVPLTYAEGSSLVVALADPLDGLAVADIAVMTKSDLLPVVANASRIEELAAEIPEPDDAVDSSGATPVLHGERGETSAVPRRSSNSLWFEDDPGPPSYKLESSDALVVEPLLGRDPEPTPAPTAPIAPSAPANEAGPPAHVPATLRDRIVNLVEEALDETAGTEITRLEAELEEERAERQKLTAELEAKLERERTARAELEALRDDERSAREKIAHGLEETSRELERTEKSLAEATTELERAESKIAAAREQRDAAFSERDAALARQSADEQRLRARLAKAGNRADELERMLEEIVAAVNGAHSASQRLASLHGKLREDAPAPATDGD